MNHEERIARLTELAQQVWPREPKVRIVEDYGYRVASGAGLGEENELLGAYHHPRALDALEAALLVLAGKDEPLSLSQAKDVWSEGFETAKRLLSAAPWVEKLACEMEADHGCGDPTCMTGDCYWAKELRARAKGNAP